ncbi:hypothetical protein VitviT2T_013437 [Vitis vinifera]|uniref:Peroxidase n=2 Tax=Vitis vinifera TaxID=29760 RepID=A0ABY9CHL2_VITVI|eukprot:XP_002279534.2 PREDICTED: putative Peroxidase 48 [Vitis vinifera]
MIIQMFGVFETHTLRKLSFLVFLLCILISLKNHNAETKNSLQTARLPPPDSSSIFSRRLSLSANFGDSRSLEYDFYRNSCPPAEQIIRTMIRRLYEVRPNVAPALLRLVFHDCFIEGCDASVLLDAVNGVRSEKDSPPNETLKGFDIIDSIKAELEAACPGIVSCADILVLAAREVVVLAGGPFYPLDTGRRDSSRAFADAATYGIPSPDEELRTTLASFASRGFNEKETVSLLGAHSIGVVHCKFFLDRLYNFHGTNRPDPSLDSGFLELMRSRCNNSHRTAPPESPISFNIQPPFSFDGLPLPSFNSSLPSSPEEPGMIMDYDGLRSNFGTLYYRSLLQGRGILYADQQLMAKEGTESWVRAYASENTLFRRDFAITMMKLSNLQVLIAPLGLVRLNCSKVG